MLGFIKNKLKAFSEKLASKAKEKAGGESKSLANEPLKQPKELFEESSEETASKTNEEPFESFHKESSESTTKENKKPKSKPFSASGEEKISFTPSLKQKIKGLIIKKIRLRENDFNDLLSDLELSFLESNISFETTEKILENIKKNLTSKEFDSNKLKEQVLLEVKKSLVDLISLNSSINLIDEINSSEKPFKILFLGLNGHGKTTSISKTTNFLQKNNFKCILAAADTFRAAAIEQLNLVGKELQTNVISKGYGADPTSVAYDAVSSAKAHSLDVVLIDSAGRQETNFNLMKELEKMNRVIKPDLKVFVMESISGKNALDTATKFNNKIGIDAVIMTKFDVDKKQGAIISILHELKKPILFLGTGQNINDFQEFDEKELISSLMD